MGVRERERKEESEGKKVEGEFLVKLEDYARYFVEYIFTDVLVAIRNVCLMTLIYRLVFICIGEDETMKSLSNISS